MIKMSFVYLLTAYTKFTEKYAIKHEENSNISKNLKQIKIL